MPDGMTPEQPQRPWQPGSTPEQIKRFQQGPEWRSEPPDIRMELDPNDPNAFAQSVAEQTAREVAEGRGGYEAPSFVQLTGIIEKDRFPSEPERVEATYREATVDIVSALFDEMNDMRLHVVPEQYGLMRHGGNLQMMRSRLEASLSRYDSFEKIGDERVRQLAVVLNADMMRYKAIETMVEHASVYQNFYYDGMYIFAALATGRRIKVMGVDDFRLMFGGLKGLDTVSGRDKLPEEIGEGSGEILRQMASDQIHFDMAVAALNRFNPNREVGKETEMEISKTEREFIGAVFAKDGEDDKKTQRIVVDGKEFDINLLSFYTTMEKEKERKVYETVMRSLLINDARRVLSGLPDNFNFDTSQQEVYDNLLAKVRTTAGEIVDNWDSLANRHRPRLAKWAGEIAFSFHVATLNINDLAYRFKWSKKDGVWSFKPEIAGPNTGFDAVNIWLHFQHEIEYMLKARVRTPMLPGVDRSEGGTKAWDVIKTIVVEREDPKIKQRIINDRGLSLGAAILGMYQGKLRLLSASDLAQVDRVRGSGFAKGDRSKMMSFNKRGLEILEKTIFGFDPWVSGRVLPIPIRPMFNGINLLNSFEVDPKGGKTVLSLLKDGKDLAGPTINFEDLDPYAVDSWQVNLKMLGDVMKFLYGQGDPKAFQELFQGDASEAIGTLIKKIDIGTRGEYLYMDLGEKDGGNVKLTKVPRQFYEIVYTSYLIVANAAFNEHGIWGAGGNWRGLDPEFFWSGHGSKRGIKDWIEAAYTSLPESKGEFDHYRDSMVLMISALAQWIVSIAPEAEKQGSKEQEMATMPFTSSYDALRSLGKIKK